jgi:(p)ppGpp synthase/HD superfamily hydrolase
MPLTERFDQALVYASMMHRAQTRKASPVPYIAHLLGVCSLVLEHGGDEDQGIAALLHDGPEDQGGAERLADIRNAFGERVARIVSGCSEDVSLGKHEWRVRKTLHLEKMAMLPAETILVVCADKVQNGRAILDESRRVGLAVFDRFGGRREGTLWYYDRMARIFTEHLPGALARESARIAAELIRVASSADDVTVRS